MTDLTGKKIANTYKDLLQIDAASDNAGLDTTLRRVQDGSGDSSAISLSQTAARVHGSLTIDNNLSVANTLYAGSFNVGEIGVSSISATNIFATSINGTNITIGGDNIVTSAIAASTQAILRADIATSIANTSATLQSNINTVSTTVSALDVQTSLNAVNIGIVQTSVAANASAIAANTSAITINTSAITSINNYLATAAFASAGTSASLETRIQSVSVLAETKASASTSANLETRINSVSVNLVSTSAALESHINTVSASLSSTNTSVAANASAIAVNSAAITSVNTRINDVSVLAETKASAATSATLETRINAVSVLAETKASASTSANLETRINAVSVLAETKASASTSANLQTQIATLSATMATSVNTRVLKSGDTMTGTLTLNADPTADLHAATKSYVDNLTAAGIHYHEAVRLEKEGNLNATYDNGTNGVGATLTNAGAQGILIVDSVTVVADDRILVYEQTDATQNGVYVATTVGSSATNWVLTRSTDTDSTGNKDSTTLDQGSYFFVEEGAAGAGESYVCNVETSINFGTTDITFVQFSSQIQYTAGTGINISPSRVISVSAVASAGTSATLETRINSVSVLAETKASAATSANLETRINAVSVLAETKASAATSANLETRINAVSILVPTSLTELGISDGTNGQFLQTDGNSGFTFASVAGGGGGIPTLTAGTNIALTEDSVTVTNATASATINVVGVASAGTSAALETRIAAVSVLTGTNAAAITSINAATYRPNTALSATTGTFTGAVSAPRVVATSAVIGTTSQWAIYVSSNNLKMDYNGTTKLRLTTAGALQVSDDLEAFTTLT